MAFGINYIRGLNDGEVRFRSGVTSTVSIGGFVLSKNSLLKVRINFLGFTECFFFDKAVQQRKYTLITTQSDFKSSMNPRFVTGFVDGEGHRCFNISITKKNNLKIGWNVQLRMQISLHKKDKPLLEDIKKYFGSQVVNITKERLESIQFRVSSVKDLTVIIDHFNKYPLITRKFADYELFKIAFDLVQKKKNI